MYRDGQLANLIRALKINWDNSKIEVFKFFAKGDHFFKGSIEYVLQYIKDIKDLEFFFKYTFFKSIIFFLNILKKL